MTAVVDPVAGDVLSRMRAGEFPEPPVGTPAHERWVAWNERKAVEEASCDEHARRTIAACRARLDQSSRELAR